MLLFVNTLEFYLLAVAVAMAIVGILMRPSDKGAARTFFAWGEIRLSSEEERAVVLSCDGSGRLTVERRGVYLETPCEINYAITLAGRDVKITEKRTESSRDFGLPFPASVDVVFSTDCLPHGRFHVFFESPWSGQWSSGSFSTAVPCRKTLALHQ